MNISLKHLTMFFIASMGLIVHTNSRCAVPKHVIIVNNSDYKIQVACLYKNSNFNQIKVLAPYAAIELTKYPDGLRVKRYGIGSSMVGYTNLDDRVRNYWPIISGFLDHRNYKDSIPMFRISPTYFGWNMELDWEHDKRMEFDENTGMTTRKGYNPFDS
jgi:hypothetical protein